MATQIFTNIALLANTRNTSGLVRKKDLAQLPCIAHAYLIVEDEQIAEIGEMEGLHYTKELTPVAGNTMVSPCWCDSHSHIVFAEAGKKNLLAK